MKYIYCQIKIAISRTEFVSLLNLVHNKFSQQDLVKIFYCILEGDAVKSFPIKMEDRARRIWKEVVSNELTGLYICTGTSGREKNLPVTESRLRLADIKAVMKNYKKRKSWLF